MFIPKTGSHPRKCSLSPMSTSTEKRRVKILGWLVPLTQSKEGKIQGLEIPR